MSCIVIRDLENFLILTEITILLFFRNSNCPGLHTMGIGTQYCDSSNDANVFPPYIVSYDQPSSHPSDSIGEYGIVNYPYDAQIPFQTPYQMQQGFQTSMWVNPEFPIHGEVVGTSQDIYGWHVRSDNQYYRNTMSWYEYCLHQDGILCQMLRWSHIDLHFGGERPWQCNINVYISLIMSFLHFYKVFP